MKMNLKRIWIDDKSQSGKLFLDGQFFCYTLERVDDLAIPAGVYSVELTMSPRFKRILPWVNVPGREGIRFHGGNTAEDSEGCILVGDKLGPNSISGGKLDGVLDHLVAKLTGQKDISLTVEN